MGRGTREDWLRLFEAQLESSQSATEFCRRRGIDPSYFSQRKRHFGWTPEAKAMRGVSERSFVEVKVSSVGSQLQLHWGTVRLSLPCATAATWVAALMRELDRAVVS